MLEDFLSNYRKATSHLYQDAASASIPTFHVEVIVRLQTAGLRLSVQTPPAGCELQSQLQLG